MRGRAVRVIEDCCLADSSLGLKMFGGRRYCVARSAAVDVVEMVGELCFACVWIGSHSWMFGCGVWRQSAIRHKQVSYKYVLHMYRVSCDPPSELGSTTRTTVGIHVL